MKKSIKRTRFNELSTFTQVLVMRNENEIREIMHRVKRDLESVKELRKENRELIGRA